ncbi:tRNA (guanosine(37)-N1)-methyltransferase TrmD [bacterium]|jgi:tRNA (guanine37-N1)-methyltransferase|nr:tRNA (guanosine(37)-N1)-methyltransferase TrmD [bacterium]MBT6831623.1 tRNA (guanosine(37)-N1)-methyltransferase TrmD [bacterium]MBT6996268.1 tRNA (guanosine(37)-N1)-methyltransferase TrmD [bacterium]MBT7772946.1 tRNA (guanosine(37)-N1)-methyltransferase TrmD [bacterium]
MIFDILTIFPEAFESFLKSSIIGRAITAGKIKVRLHDIREFSTDKHKKVDDVPFGGGAGMLMMCQPLFDAIEHVKKLEKDDAPVIFMTPSNKNFDQKMAERFSEQKKYSRVILLCGNYEGIDQRVRDALVDEEISVGNFVLTGGELPAQIFIDAVARLLPGVIGKEESHQEESFSEKLGRKNLEYPQYTRPAKFREMEVPEVLISGHHANIELWRTQNCKKQD